jgi:hypothetical protein
MLGVAVACALWDDWGCTPNFDVITSWNTKEDVGR